MTALAAVPAPEAPHNLEAEQALLGIALYDQTVTQSLEAMRVEAFYEPLHGRLWTELTTPGRLADIPILSGKFADDPAFTALGGARYLADLVDKAPAAINAPAYVEAILDAHMRRQIGELGRWVIDQTRHQGQGDAILGHLERQAADIARTNATGSSAVPAGLTALQLVKEAAAGPIPRTRTGIAVLDRALNGGLTRDDVMIIAGRPSMGKSVVATSILHGVARQGLGAMMFSLEMPLREVQARLIADAGWQDPYNSRPLRYGDILAGNIAPVASRAEEAARSLSDLTMLIDDSGGLTIDDIRRRGLRQVRAWERAGIKPGIIVVDHLGLVRPEKRTDSRAADTSAIVDQLKDIAKAWGCPLVALAQINRGPEGRQDKRPTMADINWSGSMEQIADLIAILYREAYYHERDTGPEAERKAMETRHDLEIIIQKNRKGPLGNLKAWVDVSCSAIRERNAS